MVERRNTHDDPPPHTSCEAPSCCDCECRTCKRVWEEAGRPGRNEVLVQEATVAKNHHAELRPPRVTELLRVQAIRELDAARQSLALALARIKELEGGIVAENKRTSEIEQELATLRGEEVAEMEAVRNLLISRDEDYHPDGAATVAEVVERILVERDAAKKKVEGLEHIADRFNLTRAELAKLRAAASSFLWEYRKWVPMSSRSSSRMTAAEQKLDEVILVTDGSRSVVCETCGGDLRYVGSQRGCRCPFTPSVPEPVAPNCIRCEGTGKVGPKNEYPCPDCLTHYTGVRIPPGFGDDPISRAELVAALRRGALLIALREAEGLLDQLDDIGNSSVRLNDRERLVLRVILDAAKRASTSAPNTSNGVFNSESAFESALYKDRK